MPDAAASNGPTVALIVAAGTGVRAGDGGPKQFRTLGGQTLLAHAAGAFVRHPRIDRVHVVVAEGEQARAVAALGDLAGAVSLGTGGASRQHSVRRGLEQLAAHRPARVLVHDAARPLVRAALVDRVLDGLDRASGVCPALPVVDSLRSGDDWIDGEVPRDRLWRVQTPQGFDFKALVDAHAMALEGATDDAGVLRAAGGAVLLVPGDEAAMKVTMPGDFARAEALMPPMFLTGNGFDVHRFGPGDHLWLCGVRVPHTDAVIGHSDADVGLHALTDAVLGALGDGDIGTHFPPTDPQWRGQSSDRFLAHAADLVARAGGRILHCDVTIICEAPRVGPHRAAMVARIATILAGHRPRVSVKATTTEALGFAGRREGIAAQATATIRMTDWSADEF